ncbi:MAG: GGDEF domain-containing protein [Thermodesulfovibrio sp.]|nr:GGDEF domain-containing protein [Thermodesulfovibrio sp.]
MVINELEKPKISSDLSILDLSIGDIAVRTEPLNIKTLITEAFLRFMKDEKLNLIPITERDCNTVVGQIQRNRFLEHTVLGRFGYGIHLNARKCICEVMESPSFLVEYKTTIEDASMIIQKREMKYLYDDIIICKDGEYYGIVPINILLETITQKSLIIAKDSNPLTGLPGNWAIQREIERKIREKQFFDVSYLDINNFKPYNDYYGFEKGDYVISSLGDILKKMNKRFPEIFIGHIGGDDFIMITQPDLSILLCENIVKEFEELLPLFHDEDFLRGYYISKNRKEEEEKFGLLSITCAIVSTEKRNITSFAHLASIASEVKAEAKRLSKIKGKSVIFKDRRYG